MGDQYERFVTKCVCFWCFQYTLLLIYFISLKIKCCTSCQTTPDTNWKLTVQNIFNTVPGLLIVVIYKIGHHKLAEKQNQNQHHFIRCCWKKGKVYNAGFKYISHFKQLCELGYYDCVFETHFLIHFPSSCKSIDNHTKIVNQEGYDLYFVFYCKPFHI